MVSGVPAFKLGITAAGDACVFRPDGMLDEHSSGQLHAEIMQRLGQGERKFILDGAAVSMADSSALGRLVRCFSEVRAAGGNLVFSQISPEFRRSLTVTRLSRFFSLYPSIEDAIAAMK